MGDRTLGRIVSVGVYLRTMTAFALVWWGIAWWTGNAMLLPGPDRVASALVSVTTDGDLFFHTALSLARLSLSLAIASAIAVPLGLAMGTSTTIEHIVDPVVEILRPISGIAWIPLALFIFGIGHGLPIFIMASISAWEVGTQITSLPACPTCGSNPFAAGAAFCACAMTPLAQIASTRAAAPRRGNLIDFMLFSVR